MALSLTSADQARFAAAARVLLSPLDAREPLQAYRTALEPLMKLFEFDRMGFRIPENERVRMVSHGFDPHVVDKLTHDHAGVTVGRNRYADPAVERVMRQLHERRCRVWDFPLMEQITGIPREQQQLYQEVARPGGLRYHTGAAVSLPRGEVALGMGYDDPEAGRFGHDRLKVLRLLYPALEAGIQAIWHFSQRRETLARTLDHASEGLMIFGCDGRELFRNRTLTRWFSRDPRSDVLVTGMRRSAERLARLYSADAGANAVNGAAPGTRELETPLSHYTIRASFLSPGMFASDRVALVALERSSPELPSSETLRERFGLTKRESQVALLLARGCSNREIATRLARSPHTVRHHIEHIFGKLGIRSRQAVALRLLRGSAEG